MSLSLLTFAFLVLANSLLSKALSAYESTDGFLCSADILVPLAFCAIRVVFGYTSGGVGCERTSFGSGLGKIVFGVGECLLVFGLFLLMVLTWHGQRERRRGPYNYLINLVTGNSTYDTLNSTRNLVCNSLKSGGRVVV